MKILVDRQVLEDAASFLSTFHASNTDATRKAITDAITDHDHGSRGPSEITLSPEEIQALADHNDGYALDIVRTYNLANDVACTEATASDGTFGLEITWDTNTDEASVTRDGVPVEAKS